MPMHVRWNVCVKEVKKLKTYLGFVKLDIECKISDDVKLKKQFTLFLEAGHRLLEQIKGRIKIEYTAEKQW